jgi:E3 ubiquitin-protein ligase HUWE1
MKSDTKNQGTWLSMSLEAALGCRANVFQVHKTGKKHSSNTSGTVTIHPQAAPVVCRHALDTLIALAKIFPGQFLPSTGCLQHLSFYFCPYSYFSPLPVDILLFYEE